MERTVKKKKNYNFSTHEKVTILVIPCPPCENENLA